MEVVNGSNSSRVGVGRCELSDSARSVLAAHVPTPISQLRLCKEITPSIVR